MLRYMIERRLRMILDELPKYKIITDEKRINEGMLYQAQTGQRHVTYKVNRLKYYGILFCLFYTLVRMNRGLRQYMLDNDVEDPLLHGVKKFR